MQCARVLAAAAACVLGTLLTPPPACAQIVGSMSYGMSSIEDYAPDIKPGQVRVFARILKLNDQETTALTELLQAHENEVKSEGRQVLRQIRDKTEESSLSQNAKLFEEVSKLQGEWAKKKKQLEEKFLKDVSTLLTTEQEQRWPIVERELRRPKLMTEGWMSGESVDVIRLVGTTMPQSSEKPEVVDLLERYANEVDSALQTRDAYVKSHTEGFSELVTGDPAKALSVYRDSLRNRARVRDINERYVQQVEALLDGGDRAKLDEAFRQACTQMFSKDSPTEAYATAVLACKALDPEHRAKVQQLYSAYQAKLNDLLRRSLKAYQQWEFDRVPARLQEALDGVPHVENHENQYSSASDDSPLGKVRRERIVLGRDLRRAIEAILSEQEADSVPEATIDSPVYFTYDDMPRL